MYHCLGTARQRLFNDGPRMENCTLNAWNRPAFPVRVAQVRACWFKRAEFCGTTSRQIYPFTVGASEICGCYTHDTQGAGPNHEAIDFAVDACWNLVEDNICVNAGKPAYLVMARENVSAMCRLRPYIHGWLAA